MSCLTSYSHFNCRYPRKIVYIYIVIKAWISKLTDNYLSYVDYFKILSQITFKNKMTNIYMHVKKKKYIKGEQHKKMKI